MNTSKFTAAALSLAAAATFLVGSLPAMAASASASTTPATTLPEVIAKGDQNIAIRIASLNKLNSRIHAMKNEPASQKANVANTVSTNIQNLSQLKTKLDADTNLTIARQDARSIFDAFRIYAVVLPQGYLMSSADRITTITGMMDAIGSKIETRMNADQAAGKNVAAIQTALADMHAKIANANTQSQQVLAGVSGLVPDQGDKTIIASNNAAITEARVQRDAAIADLKAARTDIKTMLDDLEAIGPVASSTATSTAA